MKNNTKEIYRKKILEKLKNIDLETKNKWNKNLFEQFINSKFYEENTCFAFYWSKEYEPDTHEIIKYLLKNNKKVCLPRMNSSQELDFYYIKNLQNLKNDNVFNIMQPEVDNNNLVNNDDINVIIIPLIAFDKKNNRLGHGKGYYDKFLSKNPKINKIIALSYPIQKISQGKIKFNTWDKHFSNIFEIKKT